MVSNEEIMEMLNVILEKVERLENIKADNITISSGAFTINCGRDSAISIDNAEEVQ